MSSGHDHHDDRPDTDVPLDALLDLDPLARRAWQAAVAAGRFLSDDRPDDLVVDTKSTPTDLVSAMDRDAERMIIDALLSGRESDAVLGEEGGARTGTSGVRWVIDPLDGTVNYLYRMPLWGVSIAAEVHGVTTVGVVVMPHLQEAYLGLRGRGAWRIRDGLAATIAVSDCRRIDEAMVATGFGYGAQGRARQGAVVAGLVGGIRDLRRTGAAVVDLCWVAGGRLDAYYEWGLNAWDYAAGALIAREAGAVVVGDGLEDAPTDGRPLIASAPLIADALRERLEGLGVSPGA